MPSYALLPSQPLRTTIRTLRRSIGHPIHPTSKETFPPSTTHVLLIHPVPCLTLFIALVDPSLNLVDTENNPYQLSADTLPPTDATSWAGAVRLSARSIWSDTGAALQGLRISTLGALRPRGAGAAAASTEIIRALVSRAGAIVTDDSPDIVLVPPGISRRGEKVRKLLDEHVLCLGAGFVVDLLLRVRADPREYVVFPEQKDLCGPVLDETVVRAGRPLPISDAVLKRSEESRNVLVKVRVNPGDQGQSKRRSKRLRQSQEQDGTESGDSVHNDSSPDSTSRIETSPETSNTPDNTVNLDEGPKKTVSRTRRSKGSTAKQQRKRPRQMAPRQPSTPKKEAEKPDETMNSTSTSSIATPQRQTSGKMMSKSESTPTEDEHKQSSSATTGEPTQPRPESSTATPQPKRPRERITKETNSVNTDVQNQTSPRSAAKLKKPVPRPQDLISPTTPATPATPAPSPPKRPRIGRSTNKPPSPIRNSELPSRPPETSFSDADTIPPRQLHFPLEDANGDISLPPAPFSHDPRSPTGSIISGRADGHSFSVDEGFRFLFSRLGAPSQADVDRLLRCIKHGGDIDDEDEHQEQNEDNIMNTDVRGAAHQSNPRGAESPLFDDEDDAFLGFHDMNQTEKTTDETIATLSEVDVAASQRKLSRSRAVNREAVDAFKIPVPRQQKMLSNVISPEMALLDRANEINITEGHDLDDQTCQDSVDNIDWILGAENLVGVSRDASCTPHTNPDVARWRRLWSSIFESDALRRFAAPSGLPDSGVRTLMGVCIRLLLSGFADDMKVTLSEKLLNVRDEQVRAGFDSLQIVLSSRNIGDLPFRDKALTAIWTTLVQSSIARGGFQGAWDVLNGALIPRVDGILNCEKFKETSRPHYLEKELTGVLQSIALTSYMFSTRLSFNLGEGTNDEDQEESMLHPENWHLICRCMDKLCEVASSPEYRSMVLVMSTSFLRTVAISIGGNIWPVTDKLVASVSKMVTRLASLNGKNCFCVAPPMIVNQFRTLVGDSNSHKRLSDSLKTICDYLFVLGWLYTVHGQGNPMKRAMTVIRSASSFTRGNGGSSDASSRSINHHVGLLLTAADSLAGSTKDGEYLLRKMLTSKCPRPQSIAERLSNSVGEQDVSWRVTLQAISKRCEVLLARQLSVHVYTDWLSQNLVETLCLLRRSPERRSANLSQKEAFRAAESVLCNLVKLMTSSLIKVNKSVTTKLRQDRALGVRLVEAAVEKPDALISICMKVSSDLLSQIRSNPEESTSKNRHGLLCSLLSLVDSQIVLIRHLLAPPTSNETRSMELNSAVKVSEDSTLLFITDDTVETVVFDVIGGGQLVGDEGTIRAAMTTTARILANLIELRSIRSGQAAHGHDDNRVGFLQRANMDATIRFESGHQRGVPMKPIAPDVEDRCRLVFWSQAVRSTWILTFLQRRERSHVMCISATVSLLASVTDDWDTEDSATAIRLATDCANLEPLKYVFGSMQSEICRLDNSDRPLARVEAVEKALRLLVKHWPAAPVRGLLKLLDFQLKRITGSRSSIQPDALILYAFTNALSAQIGGFTHARFLHSPLSDIVQVISRMTNSARDHTKTFHLVQSRVLTALCMASSDMETRVLVLRAANAFPPSDTLPGFWGEPLLPTDEVAEEWTRRAEKHAQEWRAFVFTSVIEDPLFAGRNVAYAVRRLAAAGRGGDAMRRLVQGVLVRGRGKLDWLLRRDGRALRDWSALCNQFLEA